MKPFIYSLLLLVGSSCTQPTKNTSNTLFNQGRWVDLTYPFSSESIYWPTADKFRLDTAFEGITPGGFFYSAYNFCAAEHGGTHLDAPSHFAKGKWTADQIPLTHLTGYAVVIDVSSRALANADYQISTDDITSWEKANGKIADSSIILFRTGYGAFYPDAVKYLGTAERGAQGVAQLHFPGIHPNTATWLATNRNIKAVGLDCASVDYGQSKDFKTHQILYAQNICGFENVANLQQLPAKGAYVLALPMKIKGGSGAPLRIAAWLKDE